MQEKVERPNQGGGNLDTKTRKKEKTKKKKKKGPGSKEENKCQSYQMEKGPIMGRGKEKESKMSQVY